MFERHFVGTSPNYSKSEYWLEKPEKAADLIYPYHLRAKNWFETMKNK